MVNCNLVNGDDNLMYVNLKYLLYYIIYNKRYCLGNIYVLILWYSSFVRVKSIIRYPKGSFIREIFEGVRFKY